MIARRDLYDRSGETKRLPDLDMLARAHIAQVFVGLAEQQNWAVLPYADGVVQALRHQRKEITKELEKTRVELERFRAFVAPTAAGDDGNVFQGVIDGRIRGQENKQGELNGEAEKIDAALEIMKTYVDQVRMQKEAEVNGVFFSSGTGTTTSGF